MPHPPSFQKWLSSICKVNASPFLSLRSLLDQDTYRSKQIEEYAVQLMPRSRAVSTYMLDPRLRLHQAKPIADLLAACSDENNLLETLPEYVAVLLRSDISACTRGTSSGLVNDLKLLGRRNGGFSQKLVDKTTDVQALQLKVSILNLTFIRTL